MFSHANVGVSDIGRSFDFYVAIFEPLMFELRYGGRDGPSAYWKQPGQDRPLFIIGPPANDEPPSTGNGQMIAFLAPSREVVDLFHRAAMENGGSDEGQPGLRPQYHKHYYGAYVRDPDGNKLSVCCHEPEDQ